MRWAQTRDWAGWEREAGGRAVELVDAVDAEKVQEAGRRVGDVAGQVTENVKGAVARGVERGKEMMTNAKSKVALAEERLETKLDGRVLPASDVERALAERFQNREDTRSVKEVLAARYKPIGQRDNSHLRGI